ncbi:YegP family protein [Sphingobacterium hungaricum]
MGKFIILNGANNDFQFFLRSKNGKIILTSESFPTKSDCLDAVKQVQINSNLKQNFESATNSIGYHYFNINDSNGKRLCYSGFYVSAGVRDRGIGFIIDNAKSATIEDQTTAAD